EDFVLHADEGERLIGLLGRVGGYGGDLVAGEEEALPGEGERRADARGGARRREIDGRDAGGGVGRAEDAPPEHAGEADVGGIARGAADLVGPLGARARGADVLQRLAGRVRRGLALGDLERALLEL